MNNFFAGLRRLYNPFRSGSLVLILAYLVGQPAIGADTSVADKANEAAKETTAAVQDAGRAVAADAENLWKRIDSARLKNRTPDEIVAWVIMGLLVGAVAGMVTSLKPTGMGQLGRILIGLAGAFLGGIVVRLTNLNFGWGPVLIRYEELFFSLLGAIILVLLARLISSRSKLKPKP